jgi:tripartite-type tricarboxylate transporter receptor subunit TctC
MSTARSWLATTRFALALLFGLGGACLPAAGTAQEYPVRPIRLVVPNSPGSLSDQLARLVFPKVTEGLGQPFVIDHRPGAGGSIGADLVAKASADGYTLLIATEGIMTVNPFLYPKLGYEPLRDFAAVVMLAKTSVMLVVNPSLGVRSMDELLRAARARPGEIHYSSGGNGHPQHLVMEILQNMAGVKLTHVPYKGTTPALQAVLAGEVGAHVTGVVQAGPHVNSGKVTALAFLGPRARDAFPAIPDIARAVPGFDYVSWQAVFAPAGTPPRVLEQLNAAIAGALASPEVAGRMTSVGLIPIAGPADQVNQAVRADLGVNRELVRKLGLKVD